MSFATADKNMAGGSVEAIDIDRARQLRAVAR
jgi:hypothetical protein